MNNDFPKKTDDRYKRMQSTINASVAPVLNLWRELDEQGISTSQNGLVPVESVLEVLQRTVVLVGNASNYISQCRRDNVVTKMEFKNKSLASVMKSICRKHKPEGDLLFGLAVHKALTDRADTVSALKKAEPTKLSHTASRSNDKKFFRRGPAPDTLTPLSRLAHLTTVLTLLKALLLVSRQRNLLYLFVEL